MLKKIFYITTITICSILLLLFLFISPITKYIINKNAEKWIGRKIKIESLWINIFAGSVHIQNLKLFEPKSEQIFISLADFYCNVDLLKLLSKKYSISQISITQPEINIFQDGSKLNFDDLKKRFSNETDKSTKPSEPIKYFINNFSVKSGIVNYSSTRPDATISIINLNLSSPPISYTDATYKIQSDFNFKTGGKVNSELTLKAKNLSYLLDIQTENMNLNVVLDYIKDAMKLKSFNGSLDSDLKITGDFEKATDYTLTGTMRIDNFSIVDTTGEKLTAFSSFKMDIDTLNTKAGIYNFNDIILNKPFLKFIRYVEGNNFDNIKPDTTVENATNQEEEYSNIFEMFVNYILKIVKDYSFNEYRVNIFQLNNGQVSYIDNSLQDIFNYNVDSIKLSSNNINSKNNQVNFKFSTSLNKTGFLFGTIGINPNTQYKDMDAKVSIMDFQLPDINPYSKHYLAIQFLEGVMSFEDSTTITNNYLISNNKVFIKNIKTEKTYNKPVYNLPVELAINIEKNSEGNINYEIPIKGDLNNPSIKLWNVIGQTLKNSIIKTAASQKK